jgi:hypothetical protein
MMLVVVIPAFLFCFVSFFYCFLICYYDFIFFSVFSFLIFNEHMATFHPILWPCTSVNFIDE